MVSPNRERAPYGRQHTSADQSAVDSSHSNYRGETYYGRPVLKPSPYGQLIASYLFVGGIAGASQIIATVADWTGDRRNRFITRAGTLFVSRRHSCESAFSDCRSAHTGALVQHVADFPPHFADVHRVLDAECIRRLERDHRAAAISGRSPTAPGLSARRARLCASCHRGGRNCRHVHRNITRLDQHAALGVGKPLANRALRHLRSGYFHSCFDLGRACQRRFSNNGAPIGTTRGDDCRH